MQRDVKAAELSMTNVVLNNGFQWSDLRLEQKV